MTVWSIHITSNFLMVANVIIVALLNRTGLDRTEQDRTGQDKTGQERTVQDRTKLTFKLDFQGNF